MKPCGPISSSPFRPCRTSLPARNNKDGPKKNGIIPLFTRFYTSQVVQDSFHQQYDVAFIRGHVYIHAAFRILNDNLLKKNDLFKLQKELSQQWMGASASMFSNLLLVQKRSSSSSYGKTFGFRWYASAQATQRYLVATPFASAVRVWAVACESLHVPSCIMHCTPCEHTDSYPLYQLQQSSGTTHHQDWDKPGACGTKIHLPL